MLFLDLAPPTLQNSGIFHDSTRPHLHSDGLPPKSRLYIGIKVRYKYYKKNIVVLGGLEPHMHPSRSRSAHKCIPYNNRCMQNFIQIG